MMLSLTSYRINSFSCNIIPPFIVVVELNDVFTYAHFNLIYLIKCSDSVSLSHPYYLGIELLPSSACCDHRTHNGLALLSFVGSSIGRIDEVELDWTQNAFKFLLSIMLTHSLLPPH